MNKIKKKVVASVLIGIGAIASVNATANEGTTNELSFSANMCVNSFLSKSERSGEATLSYCQQIAEKGDVIGSAILGELYIQGDKGVEKSYEQAYHWFNKAAELGHIPSIAEKGRMKMLGLGTDENIDDGISLINHALDQRSGKAAYYKSIFYLDEHLYDPKLGLNFIARIRKACEMNLLAIDYGYSDKQESFNSFMGDIVKAMPDAGPEILLECNKNVVKYHEDHKDLILHSNAGQPLEETWIMPKGPFPINSVEFWTNILAPKK